MFQVGGGGDGVCRQAEEDLAEHSADMRLMEIAPWDVDDRKKWNTVLQRRIIIINMFMLIDSPRKQTMIHHLRNK